MNLKQLLCWNYIASTPGSFCLCIWSSDTSKFTAPNCMAFVHMYLYLTQKPPLLKCWALEPMKKNSLLNIAVYIQYYLYSLGLHRFSLIFSAKVNTNSEKIRLNFAKLENGNFHTWYTVWNKKHWSFTQDINKDISPKVSLQKILFP